MKKLVDQSEKNSPGEYDYIFFERQTKKVDEHDIRRWKKLLKHYKGGSLLDMGCLDSLVCSMARKKDAYSLIMGIDYAEKAIAEMQKKYPTVKYRVDDVYSTSIPTETFDYIVAGELIEHLDRLEKFFEEAWRLLKPNGIFALSTPLEEHKEKGAVDGERHLWSFNLDDIKDFWERPKYGKVFDYAIVGSRWFPYRYCWKTLVVFCKK